MRKNLHNVPITMGQIDILTHQYLVGERHRRPRKLIDLFLILYERPHKHLMQLAKDFPSRKPEQA